MNTKEQKKALWGLLVWIIFDMQKGWINWRCGDDDEHAAMNEANLLC